MNDRVLGIIAWAKNAATRGEEGAVDNGLLITILVVLGILCLGIWLYFNVNLSQK